MARPIFDVLSQVKGGNAALFDMGRLINEVTRSVKETGKSGTITLKLTIEPDKTDNTVVSIQPDVTHKLPKRPYAKGIFYIDDKTGDLTREDPRQLELLKEREATLKEQGATTLTTVGRGTG